MTPESIAFNNLRKQRGKTATSWVTFLPSADHTGDNCDLRTEWGLHPTRGPLSVSEISPENLVHASSVHGGMLGHNQSNVLSSFPLDTARSSRASGMDLTLLLDGWFINDSFVVVTFFATLFPSKKPD